MISAIVYLVCAGFQVQAGSATGGWDTELGALHYWFALYIAGDVAAALYNALAKK